MREIWRIRWMYNTASRSIDQVVLDCSGCRPASCGMYDGQLSTAAVPFIIEEFQQLGSRLGEELLRALACDESGGAPIGPDKYAWLSSHGLGFRSVSFRDESDGARVGSLAPRLEHFRDESGQVHLDGVGGGHERDSTTRSRISGAARIRQEVAVHEGLARARL